MIDIAGFHIEPTNICTLKCSGCARTRFIDQWEQHWHNHSLDVDKLLNFLDVDLSGMAVTLCGNYGDPIYHPDFINFVKKLKNQNVNLTIATNGSYKKPTWWQELVECLTDKDKITFSIDGTPENFTQYRVNGDWESIKLAIEVCTKSQVRTIWKYIPFSYNQKDIDDVEKLSRELGIDKFKIERSDRFDEKTDYLKPDANYIGQNYQSQIKWKNSQTGTVAPRCQKGLDHFITADGFYSPCCFLADHRFYYKTPFGKNKKNYDITKTTLSEILNSKETVEFYQNLQSHSGCQFNCPG